MPRDAARPKVRAVTARSAIVRSLTTANILALGAAAFVAALWVAAIATSQTMDRVSVGSPAYVRIVAAKELLGDTLSPPENVIEPYLEANLIFSGQGALADHRVRLTALRKDFDDRQAYWRTSALPDELKREVVDTAGAEADAVWRELEDAFLPAAVAGDRAKLTASFRRLGQLYAAHRAVVDEIVAMSNAVVAASERDVEAQIAAANWWMRGLFGLMMAGLGAAFFGLRGRIAQPIAGAAGKLANLADKIAHSAKAAEAQSKLDANLTALRGALAARGAPRIVGENLYFGDYLVNNETEIVDDVRRRFGGVATIFFGDHRVATNLTNQDRRARGRHKTR